MSRASLHNLQLLRGFRRLRDLAGLRLLLSAVMVLAFSLPALTQTITPVDTDDEKPPEPVLHYYDKHGNALKEPSLVLVDNDTVKTSSKPVYPLLNSVQVGVNFFDAIMLAAGGKSASFDLWANCSLFNWFFPTVEAGIGFGKNAPEGGNFSYVAKPSFYIKAGIDYNFFYKSSPDYRLFAGIRAGFSAMNYNVNDITISSGYWDETNRFSLTGQKAKAAYGEGVVGISIKLVKGLSAGWSIRYRLMFKQWNPPNSTPWFIPGYGAGSALGFTLSLSYTIPIGNGLQRTVPEPTSAPGADYVP